jgi:integrase
MPRWPSADIEHLGLERGHRTLVITRKGGKVVTIPLAPRTARAIELAIGERTSGPLFLAGDGRRLDRLGLICVAATEVSSDRGCGAVVAHRRALAHFGRCPFSG